jgi:CheY-like chemotaxis protein
VIGSGTRSRRSSRPGAERVLLVDDDPVHRELLNAALVERGYAVESPAAGQDALELVRRHGLAAVVSDVVMPRADGFSLCLSLRDDAQLSELPVVLFSHCTNGETAELGAIVGADAFIARGPGDLERIVGELSRLLPVGRRATTKPPSGARPRARHPRSRG